jgi:hypothetical protein
MSAELKMASVTSIPLSSRSLISVSTIFSAPPEAKSEMIIRIVIE